MLAILQSVAAVGGMIGGWEIVLILAVVLILLGAKKLPDLSRGLHRGIFQFQKALDDQAHEAGKSIGGIYSKPAAEALTPDNQTAELYDPAVLGTEKTVQTQSSSNIGVLWRIWRFFVTLVRKPWFALFDRRKSP